MLGGGGGGRCALRGSIDACGDLGCDALHVFGRFGNRCDHALDVGLEAVGHLALQGLLLDLGLLLGAFLRLAQRARLQHVAAEHVDRLRHGAELVALRSPPGIVTSMSPLESRFITAVIAASGRDRPRPSRNAKNAAPARMARVARIRLCRELAAAAS